MDGAMDVWERHRDGEDVAEAGKALDGGKGARAGCVRMRGEKSIGEGDW